MTANRDLFRRCVAAALLGVCLLVPIGVPAAGAITVGAITAAPAPMTPAMTYRLGEVPADSAATVKVRRL